MSEPGASSERVHIGDTPRLTAAGDSGYEIDEAEVIRGAVSRQVLSRPATQGGHAAYDASLATQPSIQSNQGQEQFNHQKETAGEERYRRV